MAFNPPKPEAIPFTAAGFKKIQTEFQRLTDDRPNILVRLQTAREMGDLSENGAYKAARFELSDCDRNLRRLSFLLRFGEVQAPPPNLKTASFGSRVTLTRAGQTLSFTLVGKYEADPQNHFISLDSPLGQAVNDKKVGDPVTVTAPAGITTYTLTAIE